MMKAGKLVILFTLLATSRALAGAVVTLIPTIPGPYAPGQNAVIDVYITSSQTIQPRLLQFDFSNTDPAIGLAPQFTFDFSTLVIPALYSTFPNLPKPGIIYTAQAPVPGFALTLAQGVPFRAGSIMITLPEEPGNYLLDALNHNADINEGASLDFDFSNRSAPWTVQNGELTGGLAYFECLDCIPEPTTLAMLALGLVPLARRRAASK